MNPTLKVMSLRTVDYRVKGKVQGVYFRVFARDLAQQHGIVGWVKNDQVCTYPPVSFSQLPTVKLRRIITER